MEDRLEADKAEELAMTKEFEKIELERKLEAQEEKRNKSIQNFVKPK